MDEMVGIVEPRLMMVVEMVFGIVVVGRFSLEFGRRKRRELHAFPWPL